MSDIENQIEKWRHALSLLDTLKNSDVREMEDHLREEISHLRATGLTDQEAFLVARRRLGDLASLEEEFAKVNASERLLNRLWWMVGGIFALIIANCCSGMAGQAAANASLAMKWSVNAIAVSTILSQVVAFFSVTAFSVWLIARRVNTAGRHRVWLPTRRMVVTGLILMLILPAAAFAVNLLSTWHLAKSVRPEEYRRVPEVINLGLIIWHMLVPILLIAILTTVSRRAHRRTHAV